jgi:hypothetical protein
VYADSTGYFLENFQIFVVDTGPMGDDCVGVHVSVDRCGRRCGSCGHACLGTMKALLCNCLRSTPQFLAIFYLNCLINANEIFFIASKICDLTSRVMS